MVCKPFFWLYILGLPFWSFWVKDSMLHKSIFHENQDKSIANDGHICTVRGIDSLKGLDTSTLQGQSATASWSWKMWTNYFGAVFFETMTLSLFLWLLGFYWYMRRENLICHIFRGGTDPRITTSRTQKKRELPANVQDHGWGDLVIIRTWFCSMLYWAACQNDQHMIMTKIIIDGHL